MRIKLITLAVGITIWPHFALSVNADHPGRGRGPRVVVAVQATDTSGHPSLPVEIHRWQHRHVDSASTNWTPAAGSGLHFAFVLVSNGLRWIHRAPHGVHRKTKNPHKGRTRSAARGVDRSQARTDAA